MNKKIFILIIILFIIIGGVLILCRCGTKDKIDLSSYKDEEIMTLGSNGLYASKNVDILPSLYDTYYVSKILELDGYEYNLDKELCVENYSDYEILPDLYKFFYASSIGNGKAIEKEAKEYLKGIKETEGFYCSKLTSVGDDEKQKIIETYITLQIYENVGVGLTEEDETIVCNNFEKLITEEQDIDLLYYLVDVLKRFDDKDIINTNDLRVKR
jgi:hypothetical protein